MSYSNKIARSGGFTVNHREYITDVVAANGGAFSYAAYPLNPGISQLFPWLSSIAGCFEQYRMNYATVHFISTSADALTGANTALGSVIMCVDYNAANPPFTTKQQIENSALSVSGKPSMDMHFPIDCRSAKSSGAPFQNHFVRNGGTTTNQDIRFYDIGILQVATVGGQQTGGTSSQFDPFSSTQIVGSNIGELWIEYSVSFFKPLLDNESDSRINYFHFSNPNSAASDITRYDPLGGFTAANFAISYNGARTICPVPSTATNKAYVIHDDFGILLQTSTAVSTPGWILFPAGSVGGTLFVRCCMTYTDASHGIAVLPGTVPWSTPTVGSYYPKTLNAAPAVGIALSQLWCPIGITAAGNTTTYYCNAATVADYCATMECCVTITNPSVDNYIVIQNSTATALTLAVADVFISQFSTSSQTSGL